jgi:DnaJ-class molecular chaperone
VKVKTRLGGESKYQREDLYVQITRGSATYVFPEKGDEGEGGSRGDIIIHSKIQCEEGFRLSSENPYDIIHDIDVSLHDYIYGVERDIRHVSGETIHVQTVPLLNQDFPRSWSRVIIPGKGFRYDESSGDSKYGCLVINMRPVISPVNLSKVEVKEFFKKWFNEVTHHSSS